MYSEESLTGVNGDGFLLHLTAAGTAHPTPTLSLMPFYRRHPARASPRHTTTSHALFKKSPQACCASGTSRPSSCYAPMSSPSSATRTRAWSRSTCHLGPSEEDAPPTLMPHAHAPHLLCIPAPAAPHRTRAPAEAFGLRSSSRVLVERGKLWPPSTSCTAFHLTHALRYNRFGECETFPAFMHRWHRTWRKWQA